MQQICLKIQSNEQSKRVLEQEKWVLIEELTFEGYGPNGVAILVETMTDNRNRTVADVRHAFSKFGGNMGTDGSVAYLFNKIRSCTNRFIS